jgi:SAM-dependent methyltransferase
MLFDSRSHGTLITIARGVRTTTRTSILSADAEVWIADTGRASTYMSSRCFKLKRKSMDCARALLMRMFGRPKGIAGRVGGVIMAHMNRDAATEIIELQDVQPDDEVLEIGFGPGVALQVLLQHASTGKVAGVDVSHEMVAQAALRNAPAVRDGRLDLRQGGGSLAVSGRDVRQGAGDQFDAGVAGCASRLRGDSPRAQVWRDRHARLHPLLRTDKGGRYSVARRGGFCCGAYCR